MRTTRTKTRTTSPTAPTSFTKTLGRRRFVGQVLAAFPAYALLAEVAQAGATPAAKTAHRWIEDQQEIALALARGEIRPQQWQSDVQALTHGLDIAELIAEIRRSDGRDIGRALPSYPAKRTIRFRDPDGTPRQLRYAAALFVFDRGNVITPHAHRHMASAHLVIDGAFRVRTFDRIGDADGAILIRPTGDETIRIGDVSTMSTARDNVHWFVPKTETAATFDVIVTGLDAGEPRYEIEAVDPVRGRRRADGTIRAPVVGFEEAARFYTADV